MLKKLIPSCISTSTPKPETEPRSQGFVFKRTSTYKTHLGNVLITLSYSTIGLSIYTEIRFMSNTGEEERHVSSLEINPLLLGQLSGMKENYLKDKNMEDICHLLFAWDFSSAQGATLPISNYYFCVVSDEEMLILLGDMQEEAYVLTKARKGRIPDMISREDRVKIEGSVYSTKEIFGGIEKEISINLSRSVEGAMSISIDGRKLVDLNSLVKKFRGSFKLDLPGGDLIHITWDLHKWLLSCEDDNKDGSVNGVQQRNTGNNYSFSYSLDEKEAHGVFTFSFVEKGDSIENGRSINSQGNYVKLLSFDENASMTNLVQEWIAPEDERMQIGHKFSFIVCVWRS